jgi:hypothetical protein
MQVFTCFPVFVYSHPVSRNGKKARTRERHRFEATMKGASELYLIKDRRS